MFVNLITLSAMLLGGYIIGTRWTSFLQHDWKIGALHVGLMAQCAVSVTVAECREGALSPVLLAVVVLYLLVTRHSWRSGIPDHFRRQVKHLR